MKSKIDYKEITQLIDLLEARSLSEFELEVEGFKIKISRALPPKTAEARPPSNPGRDAAAAPPEQPGEAGASESPNNIHFITSPMVGTFYRAPDPASPPFVEIGEPVKPNQTVCIIEAMKLMNEIESEVEGVIEDIFIQNGKPVEYGQRLFSVRIL